MMQHKILIGLLVGLSAALFGVLAWFFMTTSQFNDTSQTHVTPPATRTATLAASIAQPIKPPANHAALPPIPKSLQGTQVDGDIIIDENKQLVVTRGLRQLFDYFLSAQGEEPLDTIHRRVSEYILSHTPQPAANQALVIYRQYIDYLTKAAALEKQWSNTQLATTKAGNIDLALVSAQQQAVKQLRQTVFDTNTNQAFFGEEQALNDYTLQVIGINQNSSLHTDERQTMLAAARQSYIASFADPAIRQKIQQQDNINALLAETQRLQQQGASQDALNIMRRRYVSEDAVQRLQALDDSEAAFKQKVAHYHQQKAQLLVQATVDKATLNQQILSLQQSMFTPTEQLRLQAVETN